MTSSIDPTTDNPYSPYAPTETQRSRTPASLNAGGFHWSWRTVLIWSVTYGLNLVVPILFSLVVCQNDAFYGVLAAIAFQYVLGLFYCSRWLLWGQMLCRGAVLVGLTQFFPILHMFAGMASLTAIRYITNFGSQQTNMPMEIVATPIQGFLTTLLVGAILMVISLGLGCLFRLITPIHWWNNSAYNDKNEELELDDRHLGSGSDPAFAPQNN